MLKNVGKRSQPFQKAGKVGSVRVVNLLLHYRVVLPCLTAWREIFCSARVTICTIYVEVVRVGVPLL